MEELVDFGRGEGEAFSRCDDPCQDGLFCGEPNHLYHFCLRYYRHQEAELA